MEEMMAESILDFWFGGMPPEGPVPPARQRFWFNGGSAVDEEIRKRFGAQVERALSGEFDRWRAAPRTCLALILLLDQFPRNIFRDTPRAYAGDGRALGLCLEGVERGYDSHLATLERAFFYLPLEHAEDLAQQERSVALFSALARQAPPALQGTCGSFLDYAVAHRDIIARFGRFPHRNRTLGRRSTPEEAEFLKQPGSSF